MIADPIASPWAPLKSPGFRALWFATVASNIGSLMQDVGVVYPLMTAMTSSPLALSIMQLTASVPLFLFALPAGALADSGKRRELLLVCTWWVIAASVLLGLLSLGGFLSPVVLLLAVTLVELGAAAAAPAQETITPDFVTAANLQQAVSLGGVGINLARLVGPRAAGLLIAAIGPSSVFFLNAASLSGVVWLLICRRAPFPLAPSTNEPFWKSIKVGLRYVANARKLRGVLSLGGVFCLLAGGIWPLFPIVIRIQLKMGPVGYGLMVAAFGSGAMAGAWIMPRIISRLSSHQIRAAAAFALGLSMAGFAVIRTIPLLTLTVILGGRLGSLRCRTSMSSCYVWWNLECGLGQWLFTSWHLTAALRPGYYFGASWPRKHPLRIHFCPPQF